MSRKLNINRIPDIKVDNNINWIHKNSREFMQKIKSLLDVLPKRKRIYHNAYHRMAHYVYPDGATE